MICRQRWGGAGRSGVERGRGGTERGGTERGGAGEQDGHRAPNQPGVAHSGTYLRRHVVDRPDLRLTVDVRRVVRKRFGDAEIDEFQVTFDENEIRRLLRMTEVEGRRVGGRWGRGTGTGMETGTEMEMETGMGDGNGDGGGWPCEQGVDGYWGLRCLDRSTQGLPGGPTAHLEVAHREDWRVWM